MQLAVGLVLLLHTASALGSAAFNRVALDNWQHRHLQSSCDTGRFPELKPTILDSRAAGVEWAGADDQHVFLITVKAAIWRSKDGGSSFEDISERFKSSIKSEGPVAITQVLSHKSKPNQMIFVGSADYMWTSQDYGETLVPHKNPGGIKGVSTVLKAHPTRPDWVLARAKRPGCQLLDEVEMRCANDLLVAEDAFTNMNWVNLTANSNGKVAGFVDWGWAVGTCSKTSCDGLHLPDQAIFATMYEHAGDWDTAWDPDVHLVRSDDWFKTIKQKVPCGNQFELLGRQIYLAVSNRCPVDFDGRPRTVDPSGIPGITLHTSEDGGASFKAACLPVALKQEGYELLETHDGQGALVIVDYLVSTPLGHLQASSAYTAGPHHAMFSLSLSSIYKQDVLSSSTDFLRVDGVPGVFLANQLTATGTDGPFGLKIKPTVQTQISFNGGGKWQSIKAPSTFNYQKCDRCGGAKECSLHLHGASSWYFGSIQYPSAYSNPSAPGLLVASGNVAAEGYGLDDNDGVCTWLSFDGGFTWSDIAEGTWIYEYADWGGLIVMSKHELNGPADEVRFSHDYGRCWRTVPLQTAMYVENIRIEPDGQRPKVLLHGKSCRKSANPRCGYDSSDTRSGTEGLVYALDIAQLMGEKMPACKSTDYEQWTVPADDHTPRCLLGAVRQFTRRKQDAVCVQGGDYKRPEPTSQPCACAAADVECDYGYVASEDGSCRALPQEKLSTCPLIDKRGYYVSSTGKRLVHGDACNSGLSSLIPDTDGKGSLNPGSKPAVQPHGGNSRQHKTSGVFVVFVVLLVLSGIFAAWYHFLASPAARAQVEDAAQSVKSFGMSLAGLVGDKVAAWTGKSRGGQGSSSSAARYVPLDEELNYFQPLPAPAADAAEAVAVAVPPAADGSSPAGNGVFTLR